ncbi:hypothetical protein BC629DRAFT_1496657 [Irpex lacteus]|nr:hypothetical protein BC629DRAFT_1496657 [Irpex lacteus]
MQMDADTLSKTSLEPFLVWSREYQADDPDGAFRFTSQLLFDKASKTVSWLETLSELCPERGPVRFMTTTRSVSSLAAAKTPPKNTICSSLSGSSGPALYALSVRDFDCGLGLHVVGNMLGELAVYSFAGDSVHKVLPLLRSINIPRWSGEDFLPKSPVPSFPPRQYIWDEPGIVLNSGEQAYQELWDAHWPSELAVPDTWRRASPFRDFDSYCYCDCIGSPAWELETASPFLGRPIPLLVCETPDEVALIKAGGLFLLHELVETQSALSLFWLLNPDLTLNEIVPLLTDRGTILRDQVVETFSPNESGMEELRLVRRIQRWEVRHGIVRWKEFKERGGEVEDYWIDGRNRLDDSDVWCEKARKSTTWTCPCSDHLLKRS